MNNRALIYNSKFLLFLIILLAIMLRFYRMEELAIFLADQASDSTVVYKMLQGDLTLLGPITSVGGFYNGPIVYYLMFPFYAIFNADPLSGTIFQSTLSIITIPFLYLLTKNLFDKRVGLVACLLFSISPLMVDYSRAAFNAHPAILFSTLILYLISIIMRKFNPIVVSILGILFGFIFQMHYLTIALLAPTLLLPLISNKNIPKLKFYVLLVVGIIIGFSPFIVFELRHDFFNIHLLLKYLNSADRPSRSLHYSLIIWPEIFEWLIIKRNAAGVIGLFTIGLPAIYLYIRNKFKKSLTLVGILFIAILLISVIYGRKMHTHYVISFHIAIIMLTALTIVNFVKNKIYILFICVLIFALNFSSYNFRYKRHPLQDGLSIQDFKKVASIIKNDEKDIYNVAMHAEGDNRAMPLRYMLMLLDEKPLTYEYYGEAKNLYFLIKKTETVEEQVMWEYTSFGKSDVVKSWDVNEMYSLFKLKKI